MKKAIKRWAKRWLITNLISSLAFSMVLGGYMTATAEHMLTTTPILRVAPSEAEVEAEVEAVGITSHSATPVTINPEANQTMAINYCLNNAPANIKVGIYKPVGDNSSQKVAILSEGVAKGAACSTLTWDGKHGAQSEVGIAGTTVENGQYFYGITVEGYSTQSTGSDYQADWIYVQTGPQDIIVDVEVNNRIFDPWDNQEAEITFTINQEAEVTLEILDEDNDKILTLLDENQYQAGEYTVDWDGEDMYGNTAQEGEYTYSLTAEQDRETGTIIVRRGYEADPTVDPRLTRVYVTKENFDPGRRESTYIAFTLTADADVTVTIYDAAGSRVERLVNSEELEANSYFVEWEAEDMIDEEGTYTYQVHARNSSGEDTITGQIEIEEDEKTNGKPNIYKDDAQQLPYLPESGNLDISFTLDRDAEVTIQIRDTRNILDTVIEDVEMSAGAHTIGWDGKDEYGQYLGDGVYRYKIIAENNRGKDVEYGNFEIQDTTDAVNVTGRCAGFVDVSEDYIYCEAIQWARNQGIFEGYSDETFKPTQTINRVEALKVILNAMGVRLIGGNNENIGFSDVGRNEWYAPYLRTALSLGIVNGYSDGTFKPGNSVLRIEALTMLLNSGKVVNDLIIPTNTYGQPYHDTPNEPGTRWYLSYAWFAKANELTNNEYYLYPGSYMTRGEMADMLYRYHLAGLDQ